MYANIFQIIQITENTDLAELCNAGEKGKADIFITGFYDRVKGFERITVVFIQRFIYPHRL